MASTPFPMFNILTATENNVNVIEFMVVCQKKSFRENIILANTVFNNIKNLLIENYGKKSTTPKDNVFTLKISKIEQPLFLLKNAIGNLGVKIAINCKASQFYKGGKYLLDGQEFTRGELVDFYKDLAKRFDIILLKDPFAAGDTEGFKELAKELTNTVIASGDLPVADFIELGSPLEPKNMAKCQKLLEIEKELHDTNK